MTQQKPNKLQPPNPLLTGPTDKRTVTGERHAESTQLKLCKDCKHYKKFYRFGPHCTRSKDGLLFDCGREREPIDPEYPVNCGPDGKYWEPING